jgi:hypothetical protein
MTYFNFFPHLRKAVAMLSLVALTAASPFASSAAPSDNDLGARLAAAESIMSSGSQSLTQLEVLSRALTDALESDSYAFQTAALRMIITYGDDVHVGKSTIFEMVRLYRDNENFAVRRMALVALGAVNDSWANDMMTRSLRFEKDAHLRHTLKAVLADVA